MNALLTPFRQLVDRKLWPLAILLIAALVAIPMLLASKDETAVTPVAQAPAGAAEEAAATQPIVTLGQAADREATRKVLGARKNPFQPAVMAKKASEQNTTTTTTTTGGTATSKTGGETDKGGATPSTGGGVTPPTTTTTDGVTAPVKKRTYELYQLKIRFGSTSSPDMANRSVKRLTALPSMAEPTLVYLGLKKDLRTAVFLVDANTFVVGDGRCVPSPANCQNLELKKGQTAFIDVLGSGGESTAQYQLDYVKVLKRTTTSAKAARAARRKTARGGRDALRANISRVNGWDYDAESGVLVDSDAE